ncbi:Hypothetical protein PBC10988_0940 [Planctomycetales bacterium 10988]|nr:Hypothetical protein PBC10988_0940 [Planctomycetales bacterium 10988]
MNNSNPLILKEISKTYPNKVNALTKIDLTIHPGETMACIGPNGCGKTTLLKIIAGLLKPTSGSISFQTSSFQKSPPWKRNIGWVSHNAALYPFWKIEKQLTVLRQKKKTLLARKKETIERFQLQDLLDRYPHQVSSGQRQRIALAKSWLNQPEILLLDEPFTNLDLYQKEHLRQELADLIRSRKGRGITLLVSHEPQVAKSLADQMIVLSGGELKQCGTYYELQNFPEHIEVAKSICFPTMNFLSLRLHPSEPCLVHSVSNRTLFQLEDDDYKKLTTRKELSESFVIGIDPHDLEMITIEESKQGIDPPTRGFLVSAPIELNSTETGANSTLYRLSSMDKVLKLRVDTLATYPANVGEKVIVRCSIKKIHWFHKRTGMRIEIGL